MELLQFEKEYKIHIYETGPDGKLNLYSLLNYFQDIAFDHAIKLGIGRDDLICNNHIWVLSRIYTIIEKWPSCNESLIIKTWPAGTDKLFAIRNYEVSLKGKQIAFSTSSWLILDRTTRKAQRPDSILSQFRSDPQPESSRIRYATKIGSFSEEGCLSPVFRVRISDIDVNMHSNNVRYLKWVYDCYKLDFIMNYCPQSVEINYLAECTFDEELIIRTSVDNANGTFYYHSIVRKNDTKELCRIRIEWVKCNKN